jgi:3-oxoacyl-[acyl-carrier-protein] synthase III
MLNLLGLSVYTPKDRLVARAAQGMDLTKYRGWPKFCEAAKNEHPSSMATRVAKRALKDARISPRDLSYVFFNGVSRDFPPSWSVAIEVMKNLGCQSQCLGLDYSVGCLGTLVGMRLLSGLLNQNRPQYGLIICAEKWAYTVDRKDSNSMSLWGHSDGAGALVVGNVLGPSGFARFTDVEFSSHGAYNNLIRIKYGGTRFPVPPTSERKPFLRILEKVPTDQISRTYQRHLEQAYQKIRSRNDRSFDYLVINQMPRGILMRVKDSFDIRDSQIMITGDRYGHVGSADIIIGMSEVRELASPGQGCLVASTSPSQFGVGVLNF